jgi:hypothetical protein
MAILLPTEQFLHPHLPEVEKKRGVEEAERRKGNYFYITTYRRPGSGNFNKSAFSP